MRTQSATAAASQPMTAVNFEVPTGACDCHVHVHGDPARFPYFAGRTYTPETALPEELAALHKALHVQRVVIVTPSVYGTDNASTLYGIKAYGSSARGVAVIDDKTSDRALEEMDQAGVRGIRLNLATAGINDGVACRDKLQRAIERTRQRSWHVQVFTTPAMIAQMQQVVASSPVPIVFDHFGGAQAEHGPDQAGFSELVELVRSGRAWVKISGAYRASQQKPDYADAAPLAKQLIAANPDRILWGTDWPHPNSVTPPGRKPTDVTPLLEIDDGHLLNQLAAWAPEAATRKKILVDNPARLYGFSSS